MNSRFGVTLVELLIASSLLVLFLSGGFYLYFHGQGTINKGTWINNSTIKEGIATRELSELSKASSYPSKILKNNLIINDNDNFKAKLPQGVGEISFDTLPKEILAFPICSCQTDEADINKKGKIKWIILKLTNNQESKEQCNLNLVQSYTSNYTLSDDGNGNGLLDYSNNLQAFSDKIILKDIEKASVVKEASDSVRIDLVLSSAKHSGFKKNVTLKFPLNVEFQ